MKVQAYISFAGRCEEALAFNLRHVDRQVWCAVDGEC